MKSARLYEIGVIYLVLYEFVHMFSINFISACSVIYLLLSSNVIDGELNLFVKLRQTFLQMFLISFNSKHSHVQVILE